MRIALINPIRPQPGSGDGMTEYTYQLYKRLAKKHKVDLLYPLNESKRNDVIGLTYTYFFFGSRIAALAKKNYDIIHITNHEMGFAAKILKDQGSDAKIVTTIHDLMRLKQGYNQGFLQNRYNHLVAESIKTAFRNSDYIIFSAESVQHDARMHLGAAGRWKTVLLGPRDNFVETEVARKRKSGVFEVGYVGALSYRKNVLFMLKTALRLKGNSRFRFTIYGSGPDHAALAKFKKDNRLDNVRFMGFAPEGKLLGIYDSFDLFFYPTLEEGSSLPVLDAQARGLPVIVYKRNMIDKPVTKYCFVAENEVDASNLLLRFAKEGFDYRIRNKEIAYSRGFSWDNISKITESIYRELV